VRLIKSLWRGEIALWKCFWLFGVVGLLGLSYAQGWFNLSIIKNLPGASVYLIIAFAALSLIYLLIILVSVWRSATRYKGIKIWKYLAKFAVISVVSVNIYAFYRMIAIDTNDPGKDSANIETTLQYDDSYPFVAFWKEDCSDDFGLAIDKVGNGMYSVSFCGPGGCFKPGTYRPNTVLLGDVNYRIVNKDIIEVLGQDGYSRYYRCN